MKELRMHEMEKVSGAARAFVVSILAAAAWDGIKQTYKHRKAIGRAFSRAWNYSMRENGKRIFPIMINMQLG